jgi:uptake hydrogenase large subunit
MTRIVLGPFNRVEGDLEVSLEVEGGEVASAQVNSPLFRGFELLLVGRAPLDALVVVPRICGICSVSQSAAAAAAIADAAGIAPTLNGRLAQQLVLATENLADHLTHFYLFFMPDFARPAYAGRPWFATVSERFAATRGSAAAELLTARANLLKLMGFLAGKWPHTLALQPGGSSRAVSSAERIRLQALLRQFRSFLEGTLFGDRLEAVAALASEEALRTWAAGRASDFAHFLAAAYDLKLENSGRGAELFLSYGAYGHFASGLRRAGQSAEPLDASLITEDHTSAWLRGDEPLPPAAGRTQIDPDKPGAYTWCKAPRYGGEVAEVGALARQLVDGHPLAEDYVGRHGGSVTARVVARLIEIARVLPLLEEWVREIAPGEPFCNTCPLPEEGQGVGLVEAARGSLGHWLEIRRGRIERYQIVAPTTWNFSPRDAAGRPGPLEQALVGLPAGEGAPPTVQHVVRSFDPCMVCTVH